MEFEKKEKMARLLTVDEVRKRHWDPVRKRGRPIFFITLQDPSKSELRSTRRFEEVFLPDGSLIKKKRSEAQGGSRRCEKQ